MSYKTRPTGDFLKTGKVGKSAFEFGEHSSPPCLPIFSFVKLNDSLSYQPDIKTKTTTKVNSVLIFFCFVVDFSVDQ